MPVVVVLPTTPTCRDLPWLRASRLPPLLVPYYGINLRSAAFILTHRSLILDYYVTGWTTTALRLPHFCTYVLAGSLFPVYVILDTLFPAEHYYVVMAFGSDTFAILPLHTDVLRAVGLLVRRLRYATLRALLGLFVNGYSAS